MKRRLCSLLLIFLMAVSLLPASALAAGNMTTSDQGVDFIAEFEGYRQYAYQSGSYWYIGYGTACEENQYPDGVTEEEAKMLLREELADKEADVNAFLNEYGITLAQNQFDALMSLTYNLGTSWINPQYRICQALIDGIDQYSDQEVVNIIGTWCHVGDDPMDGLVDRRLQEAYLFLYGTYENDGDEDYCYVHYETGEGDIDHSTVFYPVSGTYDTLPTPEWEGYTFEGWYTEDGEPFTGDEIVLSDVVVHAAWDPAVTSGTEENAPDWKSPYSDVKEGAWYYDEIRDLTLAGLVDGYPGGTFKPNQPVTSGEALKMILLAAGWELQPKGETHWASNYLDIAVKEGYLAAGEVTNLNASITRGMIAKLAAQALELDAPATGTKSPFADTNDPYVVSLALAGIVEGSGDGSGVRYYLPNNTLTRAELCAIVLRMYRYEPPKEPENPTEPEEPEVNDPSQSGYILYGNKKIPVLKDVPVCQYDKSLFRKEGSIMYYDDPRTPTYIGIDVSSYQGDIDWKKVAASGVEYAIIRVGFRGYTAGTLNMDRYFEKNIQGALAAGLDVGVYFFSQAITQAEAVEEAQYVLDAIRGYKVTLPVVFDWEPVSSDSARTNGISNEMLTNCAVSFCQTVERAGYEAMVYFNQPVGYTKYDLSKLTAWDFWFAQYPPSSAMYPAMYYDYQMWQYTSSGTVDGINGKVDMNISWKRW